MSAIEVTAHQMSTIARLGAALPSSYHLDERQHNALAVVLDDGTDGEPTTLLVLAANGEVRPAGGEYAQPRGFDARPCPTDGCDARRGDPFDQHNMQADCPSAIPF